ncbi:MAG: aspartyl protease family protein [Egibacteraceae bacterium]
MKLEFRPLPGASELTPRPIVDVQVEGFDRAPLGCLMDTGSLHNRFGAWVAHSAGIDLSTARAESLGVGGRPTTARTVTIGLRVGDVSWEAPVSFCDPWPWDFQLLGQEGFFRWFRVVVEAANRSLELEPQA